jgi:hypothetical protein
MSTTWDRRVSLIMIELLGDPGLVRHFIRILNPLRSEFLFEEGRDFHCSLRLTAAKRRAKTRELRERGEFDSMNPGVPLTFPLPFDCSVWRNSRIMLKVIELFVDGFMVTDVPPHVLEGENEIFERVQKTSQKIETVNKYMGATIATPWNSLKQINEAAEEYRLAVEDRLRVAPVALIYPKLLTTLGPASQPMCVIID